jgi:hypothetical protein
VRCRDALKARLTQLSANTRAQQRGMVFGGSVAARLLWRCDDGKSVGREQNAFPSNRNSVLKWSKQRNATRKERTTWDKAKADCGWSQVTSLQPQLFRAKFRTVFSVFQYLQPPSRPPNDIDDHTPCAVVCEGHFVPRSHLSVSSPTTNRFRFSPPLTTQPSYSGRPSPPWRRQSTDAHSLMRRALSPSLSLILAVVV